MAVLEGKNVVLGVTGGIAAYKACEVVSGLCKLGAHVYVIMTKNACEFVTPLTFQTLSKHAVVVDTFATPDHMEVEHIALAKRADLFLIAPATANIIAKMACGIADDMLSTTVMATKAPILLAPAMNTAMWENVATQQNVRTLLSRGVNMIGPEGGKLACGDVGVGRMSEPDEIVSECERLIRKNQDLLGMKILVTAGPTREPIDPVRYLTNKSSGKMGYALAQAAIERGAKVTLVTGPTALEKPAAENIISIESTEELYQAMQKWCPEQDMIIQAAAPADFTPVCVASSKIKKQADEKLTLTFIQTPDVAKMVGEGKRNGQVIVCFAAETNDVEQNARLKLKMKHADLIVANDVGQPGAGFDVDTNIITMIDAEQSVSLPIMSKRAAADQILDRAMIIHGKSKEKTQNWR